MDLIIYVFLRDFWQDFVINCYIASVESCTVFYLMESTHYVDVLVCTERRANVQ